MSFIETMITDLTSFDLDSGFVSALTKTLADYNPTANAFIINVMKNTVYAVGASLLTLFMLIELVAMVNRADGGSGLGGIKLPANMFIKFAIYAMLFTHIPAILTGIEQVAVSIASGMASTGYSINMGISASQVTNMADVINDLSFFDRIFTYIIVLLCWLTVKVVQAIIQLTAVFRLFEMWIMLLLSPIPLSTFASSEFKQTAFSFIKAFTATALKSSAIIACFVVYNALMGTLIVNYDPSLDVSEYIHGILVQNIIYTIVLAFSVLGSGKIINRIMGVF